MDKQDIKHTHEHENVNHETVPVNNSGSDNVLAAVSQRKFALLFILLILIIAVAVSIKLYKPAQKQSLTVKKTIFKQALVKRSKDLGVLNRGLTGKAIDVNTGKIIAAARIFTPTDKTVYLELDFNSAPKGLAVDYIRYKDGRYVDHGEVIIPKDNTTNTLFTWTIGSLFANKRDGNWRVATYTNGILAKRINYLIKNDKVSYVYPDKPIKSTDSDYSLHTSLALHSPTQ